VTQAVYAYYPGCKWAEVDRSYPLVQASGTVRAIDLSHGDSPWLHITHDLQLDVEVDQASAWLVLGDGRPGSLLHVEAEAGAFPVDYRPTAGDRVTIAGRWIYDCGHDPKTEIHPAAVVASEHDEWRADFAGGPQPQHVRVLRVWMNSEPGVVHVPLAPIDLRVRFPSRQTGTGQGAIPVVEVVAGEPSAVRWTISTGVEAVPEPVAALHIVPPAPDESASFELLLGYRVTAGLPPPNPPISYSVAFDRLVVHDDLRRKSRNTTGIPTDLLAPQLGFPGSGNWIMQAIVGHAWRVLLDDAPVRSGHTYSLAAVPPVPLFAPGEEHLRMAITGYAENDPSDGVQLASASIGTSEEAVELASSSIDQTAVLKWDAGRLADLCCGTLQSFKPAHGAWTLYYHVTRATP
jgi:hypothetical protein